MGDNNNNNNEYYELERRLKTFIDDALVQFSQNLILDFKNMLLEHDKELAKILSEQDKVILLVKKDVESLQHDIKENEEKMDEFKKETREKISTLVADDNKLKGAGALGKWLAGSGIIGGIITLVAIAVKFFSGV